MNVISSYLQGFSNNYPVGRGMGLMGGGADWRGRGLLEGALIKPFSF